MRDGRTIVVPGGGDGPTESASPRKRASLVVLTGPRVGESLPLEKPRTIVGRGPGVDLTLDDPAMSRQHMAVEIRDGRFQVRDLDSTNGLMLNGRIITAGELKHGDRLKAGDHELEFILEERRRRPHTYVLPG
jgi:pSer/pThr/pTyr-binding forkhead associated (FHA) protein